MLPVFRLFHCHLQSFNAEARIHCIRQPPGQHFPARPIHYGDKIQEAAIDGDIRDVTAPDLIGAVDHHAAKEIRVDPVFGMRPAGIRWLVDGLQSHQAHEPANPVTANLDPISAQMTPDLAAAVEWVSQIQGINLPHQ